MKTQSFHESEPSGGSTAALLMNWSLVEPTTGEAAAKQRTRVGNMATA